MMNLLKKLAACGLSLTMILSLAACGGTDDTSSGESGGEPVKYLIGISQYGQHGSLDNCREGFLQGLEQAGLVEGTDFEVDYQNANFDDNQATQIGQMFSAEDADLMVGIATNSAIACFNAAEDKDIPVIFTAITDPVGAHLDAGNITGTSDALPVEGQLQLIRALQPDADTIGIVYTTSEANSVYSISVYEELATDYGFTIDAVGVTSQAEVTQAVDTLLSHGVDCLSNLTDNNVVGVLGAILEKTDEAGIPVYGSEVEQVKLGCVGGAGLDYIQLGIQTGLMAAKVLTGEAGKHDGVIHRHEGLTDRLDYEVELAVVLGKAARDVKAADAADYMFGYTILNDVSARDLQTGHKQWYFGKSLDGFTPMGPVLVTADEIAYPPALEITSRVNGELRQKSNTALLITSIGQILEELTGGMTLLPGTIIATGTPAGVGMGFDPPRFLQSGDTVECAIEGIGTLCSTVI